MELQISRSVCPKFRRKIIYNELRQYIWKASSERSANDEHFGAQTNDASKMSLKGKVKLPAKLVDFYYTQNSNNFLK